MQALLALEFSIFAMIAVGVLVRRIGIVGKQGEKNITDLVLYVILPCNILNSFMTDLTGGMLKDCLWVLGISACIQAIAVVYGRTAFRRQSDAHRRNLAYAMICSNAGFLGNPLAEGLYGPAGLMLASIYLIPQRIMMWSEGLAIYSGSGVARSVLKRVLTHPCVISCFLGLALMICGIRLPDLLLAPIQTLGRCNTALSMMVIGMILAEIDPRTLVDKSVAMFTLHRLVILPLGIYAICRLLPISATVRGVSVLLAAMPAGATTSMLAARYDQDPQYATRLIVFSTLCSIPAIVLWSMLLRA